MKKFAGVEKPHIEIRCFSFRNENSIIEICAEAINCGLGITGSGLTGSKQLKVSVEEK